MALDFIVASPSGAPDARLPIAASRAGAIGVLDLAFASDHAAAIAALRQLSVQGRGRHGVLLDDPELLRALLAEDLPAPYAVLLSHTAGERLEELVALARAHGARALAVATGVEEARAGARAGADAVVAKGHEAGGWVGEESTFVLLQRLAGEVDVPVWAHGGVGLHTAAACLVAGAAGAVLDSQVLLCRETPLSAAVKARVAGLDGSETVCLGAELGARFRLYARPDLEPPAELARIEARLLGAADARAAWLDAVRARAGWRRPDESVLPLGQDACFAADLARRFTTVAGVLDGIRSAAADQCRSARRANPLAEGAPLAVSHGTRFPIVQGPMTRVSDRADFAAAVAEGGGLPFLALALMRGPEAAELLVETQRRLGALPWGVGILGFVPAALRAEQLEAIRACRPPFALIAGGRPDQARALEDEGIATYLHVPSPGLLELYLKDGARRFVFEGRECGGHVGPRTSFVLWDTMVRTLLASVRPGAAASDYHVLLAGGIHDAASAAMAAAIAAPLADRGMRVGCLAGTAYLFCEEAVAAGAITPGFQAAAQACDGTVLLESGPGHATRCLASPFAEEFDGERRRLRERELPAQEIRNALEELNIGRLRIASKGVDRHPRFGADPDAPKLAAVDAEDQWRRGMYMIGQVAALRDGVVGVEDLHRELAAGSTTRLAELGLPAPRVAGERALPPADIAIVGMGCVLPGAADLATFWANVVGGVDAVGEVPPDRFDWRQYFDPDRTARDKVYSRWGGFIPDVPFDPVAFGMPPKSLHSIEPFQLLALLTADAALRDAGYAERPFPRERTSVVFGAGGGGAALGVGYTARSTLPMLVGDAAAELTEALGDALPEWTEDSFPGVLMNVAAGRIANRLDLGGANYTVDAACASALAAVCLAAGDLQAGTSDMAIVGGVDAIQTPFAYLCFAKTQALSPRGRCRPFDADADGIAISEGFGAVVLKRLADAERDGDRIYAVIRGLGGASDGRDRSLTAPRPEGQMRALNRAYAHAGFSPATVGLVEAHGTGTVAGDGAEVKSLTSVFGAAGAGRQACAIGSVKSMIGHTKATAGIAGLIKAALALHNRVLPPTLGVSRPNPKADFESSPFYVNTEARPWLRGTEEHPRRAAVSAFGFGGTNFHAVLEEYSGGYLEGEDVTLDAWPAELLLWRGRSRADIRAAVSSLLAQLDRGADPALADLAHTLAADAAAVPAGGPALAVVAESRAGLVAQLRRAVDVLAGRDEREHSDDGVHFADRPLAGPDAIAFLFPGQGSQFVGMARELALVFGEVRASFERADRVLADRFDRPLSRFVFPPPVFDDAARKRLQAELTQTDVAQPALGATDLAYLRLMEAFGVAPAMVAGHSYGEFVALAAAGSLTEDDLLRLSEARGRFIREGAAEESGCMAAVTAPAEALAPLLADDLVIANLNAPDQTVLSGSRERVEQAVAWCAERELSARMLPVACAFHSPFVTAAQQRLAGELRATEIRPPRIPVFSNTTGARYPDDPASIAELLGEHLIRPVDFRSETEAMYDAGARIFVEVGPRSVLGGLVRRTLADRPHACVSLDRPGRPGMVQLLHGLAALAAEGTPLALERLFRGRSVRRLALGALDRDATRSPSTWLVNGARAWPAGGPAPESPRAPVPIAVRDGQAPADTSTPQQGKVPVNPTSDNGHDPGVSLGPAPARLPAPADSPPAAHPDRVSDVMRRYQDVMQQFLDTERSVMLAYLTQGRAGAAPPPAPNGRAGGRLERPGAALPAPAAPVVAPAPEAAPAPAAPAANGPVAVTRDALTSQLLAVVSERTGYPTDMLDLDADLEADLSIDSIKRVEIAGTIVEALPVPAGATLDPEQMTASRTLREVIDVLEALLQGGGEAPIAVASQAAAPAPPQAVAPAPPQEEEDRRPFVREPADQPIGRFVLRARDAPAIRDRAGLAPDGAVVIVDDGAGVAGALAARLRTHGHRPVRIVREPDAGDADAVVADLDGPDAAAAALRQVAGRVKAIVHLGALAGDRRASARELFLLAQAARADLAHAAAAGGAAVLGASALGGSFAVDGDVPADAPEQGMLAGFLKTLAIEWPDVRVKAVDLDAAEPAAAAAALLDELTAADGLVEVGYRAGRRTALQLVPAPVDDRLDSPPLEPGAVLLVTGGARGITAAAALALARRYRPTLVLVGRTRLADEDPALAGVTEPRALRQALLERMRAAGDGLTPAAVEAEYRRVARVREVRDTLAQLDAAGAQADYRSCDVADAEAFGALIDDVHRTHGRIDGAIHGAGLIEDKLVADKDPASFDRVVATKLAGAAVLAAKLRPEELRFLVLFSSVSGRFGNRGQADYAAASEALNKLAQELDRRWPARVVAIDWGPWLTTGMVSPEVRRQFAERGVALIEPETGCRRLDSELRGGRKGEPEVLIGGMAGTPPPAAGPLLAVNASLARGPERGLEATRRFDLDDDLYLTDHRLDGLAVVPFAVATELMAEVAAASRPDGAVAALERIRLLRGISVPDGGTVVRAVATPAAGDAVDVAVVGDEESPRKLYSARALLRARAAPPAPPEPLDDLPAFPMTVAEAYGALLFHGPLFQRIEAIDGMDARGARARLRPCPPSSCLRGAAPEASWWLDPIVYDCALQLQVLWARLNWDVTLLPAEIGGARALAPLGADPLRLELRIDPACRAPLCRADHFFFDAADRLVATLTGVVGTGSRALNRLAGTAGAGRMGSSDEGALEGVRATT